MFERLLPREDLVADKAFSRRRALPADDEHLRIAFIRKSSDWCALCSGHHCPVPTRCAIATAGMRTAGVERSLASFTNRQTLAREMRCLLAT